MFLICANDNSNDKPLYNREVILENSEFFDQAVIDAMYTESISDIELEQIFTKIGFQVTIDTVEKEGKTTKIFTLKHEKFFMERSVSGVEFSAPIKKIFGTYNVNTFNDINNNLYGNHYGNTLGLINAYYILTGQSMVVYPKGISYKKPFFTSVSDIYIKQIFINSDKDIDVDYVKSQNKILIEQNFINKLLESFFDINNRLRHVFNMDINQLQNGLCSQGYINSNIYDKTVFYLKDSSALVIYTINCGEKYKLHRVIVSGKYISKKLLKKLNKVINILFKTSKYYTMDIKAINDMVAIFGVKCIDANREILENNKFNLHIEISNHSIDEQIVDIIFRNFPVKTSILLRLAANHGIYVGESIDERNIQKFMGVLQTFLGEQPQIHVDKGLLCFGFSKCPDGWQWITENMQSILKMTFHPTKGNMIAVSPGRYRKFAIKKNLLFLATSVNLVFPLSLNFLSNCGLSPFLEVEYFSYNNWKYSLDFSIPIYIDRIKNSLWTVKDYINNKEHNMMGKLRDFFLPQLNLSMENNNKNSINRFSLNYNASNFTNSISDSMGFKKKDNFAENDVHIFDLIWDFKYNLLNFKNNQSGLQFNSKFSMWPQKLSGGLKFSPSYHRLLQIGQNKLIFSGLLGTGINRNYLGSFFNTGDMRIILLDSDKKLFDHIAIARMFFLKEIMDSTMLMGIPIFNISYGFFMNGGIFRAFSLKNYREKNNEVIIDSIFDNKWFLPGIFLSFGFIFLLEIQGMAIFIAIGSDIFSGKITFDFGYIGNYNPKMIDNLMHTMR